MNRGEKALEAYLVAAARTGDRRALGQLMALRGPRLMAHAVRLLGEVEGARDVVQDAWIDIVGGMRGLRETRAFLPWALRIVSRRVARVISGRQRDRRLRRKPWDHVTPTCRAADVAEKFGMVSLTVT